MVETWTPYAQAIFEIARDTGKEEKYMSDLESLSSIWQQEKILCLPYLIQRSQKRQKHGF